MIKGGDVKELKFRAAVSGISRRGVRVTKFSDWPCLRILYVIRPILNFIL